MKIYLQDKEAVIGEQGSRTSGLTEEEVLKAAEKYGRNELDKPKGPSLLVRFFKQMADPMIIVLLAAAAVSAVIAVMENESMADVIIILAVVVINSILGVYQDSKAEKSIEALQKMSAAKTRVRRDGVVKVVDSSELVPGDIVILEAGDAVPADGRLIECASLKVEESALTGESVPVEKFIDAIMLKEGSDDVPLGDRKNMIYMGSTAVYGRGAAVITGTGMNTEMGKIAAALSEAKEGKTPLQKKLAQLSKILTVLVLAICVVIFATQLIRNGKFDLASVMNSFMIAVSLAVAAIPEGLVAVVTVVLSIGVTNMSKKNAIIRKLTAVETLGCAQIICSDKTGTLTQNKMTVTESYGATEKLAKYMTLCCDAEVDTNGEVVGEPTEAALVAWAFDQGMPRYDLKKEYKRVGEAPFDSERKMMSVVVDRGDLFRQITKGGPDTVLAKCSTYFENGAEHALTDEKRREIMAANKAMADKALRVLACAFRNHSSMPESFEPEYLEKDMCFMGLCGMIDPVRPEVKAAIKECESAGIRPIMITGDHVDTASAIGRELGILREGDRAIMGSELDKMSDEEFMKVFRSISVYARVQPEHKTRIVKAWQDTGHVTAMTGDGVNDAPSIKTADIGVGMGITGTDVTKNAADMVLADDNFATIVGAVEEGRRIYDNILKAIQFLLSSNVSEVIAIFAATLIGFTILKPVQLLWINLITDTLPALALGVEAADRFVMKRDPRPTNASIFAGGVGFDILYQGFLIAALTVVSFFIGEFMQSGSLAVRESIDGRTMAFLTLSMAEIFHSINMRSQRESIFRVKTVNKLLIISVLVGFGATVLVTTVPFLKNAFGFADTGIKEYLIAILLGFLVMPVVECVKAIQRGAAKRREKGPKGA